MEQKAKARVIGRYPVRKKIGQGAMGSVYLAHDEMIDRQVAIKAIRLAKNKSPEERKRANAQFFEEARLIGKLSHPHITSVFDMGIHGKTPYLVMEYLSGITLDRIIKRRIQIPLPHKISLIVMICQAVHFIHRHGILHRDLKPSNIMIDMAQRTPKIMDFGIAKPVKSPNGDITEWAVENESLCGTPFYMSPEQILGKEMSPRADIFSLGVVFYEWLSGARPFHGENMLDILQAILEQKPMPLPQIADVDAELAKIIHRALEKNPDKRFATADEMADALLIYQELESQQDLDASETLDVTMGARQNITDFRKQYPFFYDFTDKELFEIFRIATPESYSPGEVIIHEGHTGNRMYFIIEGRVQVTKRTGSKSAILEELEAGESFGEMSFIDRSPRVASIVALEPTHVMALNEAVLRQANPALSLKLLRALGSTLAERLRATDKKYLDLIDGLQKLARETGFLQK